jgi:hypothetical protein
MFKLNVQNQMVDEYDKDRYVKVVDKLKQSTEVLKSFHHTDNGCMMLVKYAEKKMYV